MNIGALVTLLKLFEGSGLTQAPPTSTRKFEEGFRFFKKKVPSGKGQGESRDLGLLRHFK